MGKNLRAAIAALAVVAAMAVGPIPTASAFVEKGGDAHCAVQVHPIGSVDAAAEPACFDTEDAVADFLAGVGVSEEGARGVAASTVVGAVYKDHNGAGASLTFWGSSGCSGVTFGFPSLASGWDNSISSVRASNGCWVTLYTATSYGGSRLNCTPYCASIGTWNDNVKSLVFRPQGTFG